MKMRAVSVIVLLLYIILLSTDALSLGNRAKEPKMKDPLPAGDLNRTMRDVLLEPRIKITNQVYDFGQVRPGAQSNAVFDMVNVGTATLEIQGALSTCGCLKPAFSKNRVRQNAVIKNGVMFQDDVDTGIQEVVTKDNPLILEAGQSARLEVAFTASALQGKYKKRIYLLSNDPVTPKVEIEIVAEVISKVEVTPEAVDLRLDQDNAGMKEIVLKSVDKREFSIKEIKVTNSVMAIPFDPEKRASEFILKPTVNIEQLTQNPNGLIQIRTDYPDGGRQAIRYVTKPYYEVSRPRLFLQNIDPQQASIERLLEVRGNYGKSVQIKSFKSKNGYLDVLDQQGIGEQVKLTIIVNPPTQDKLFFTDVLTIFLEDEYELQVNCTGYFKKQDKNR